MLKRIMQYLEELPHNLTDCDKAPLTNAGL